MVFLTINLKMSKTKQAKKEHTKKYEEKLKINGSFMEVLKASVPKKDEKKSS